MKTLALALLSAALIAGSTGCCCMGGHGGCSPCASNACGPATYGYAPSYGGCPTCAPSYGGCPNGNCGVGNQYVAPQGVFPQGSYYGPTDVMQASATMGGTPIAMSPMNSIAMQPTYGQTAMSNGFAQTAMVPLQSLPTY